MDRLSFADAHAPLSCVHGLLVLFVLLECNVCVVARLLEQAGATVQWRAGRVWFPTIQLVLPLRTWTMQLQHCCPVPAGRLEVADIAFQNEYGGMFEDTASFTNNARVGARHVNS